MKKLSLLLAFFMTLTLCFASCGASKEGSLFTPGTISENVYTSEWLGLSFKPTDKMELADAVELEYLMSPSESAYYTDEATGEEKIDYSKVGTVYDMLATHTETNCSALVMAQYTDEETTVEDYLETLREEIDGQLAGESELGNVIFADTKTAKLAGAKYTVFEYSVNAGEMTLKQSMYIRKVGDRIANICFTYSDAAELNEFVSCFKAN